MKDKRVAREVEPDECYVFGPPRKARRPDLTIEVIWTSGSIDKLEIYRKLTVGEVWIWRDGKLSYAGEVAQGVEANEDYEKRLVPSKRQVPTVPEGKAIWVEPQYCDVYHSGFDDKGHLKAPRFKGWGKAPEKGGE